MHCRLKRASGSSSITPGVGYVHICKCMHVRDGAPKPFFTGLQTNEMRTSSVCLTKTVIQFLRDEIQLQYALCVKRELCTIEMETLPESERERQEWAGRHQEMPREYLDSITKDGQVAARLRTKVPFKFEPLAAHHAPRRNATRFGCVLNALVRSNLSDKQGFSRSSFIVEVLFFYLLQSFLGKVVETLSRGILIVPAKGTKSHAKRIRRDTSVGRLPGK